MTCFMLFNIFFTVIIIKDSFYSIAAYCKFIIELFFLTGKDVVDAKVIMCEVTI